MYKPSVRRRRTIRLKAYDYSQAGAYFVTICTQGKACLFGEIVDGEMQLNDAGRMVVQTWHDVARRFRGIDLDAFVAMPNHVHGIVSIVGAQFIAPGEMGVMNHAPTLGEIVRTFKAVATRRIRQLGLEMFAWQRNYYEHVIRGEDDLASIREYAAGNPARWAEDRENPARMEVHG